MFSTIETTLPMKKIKTLGWWGGEGVGLVHSGTHSMALPPSKTITLWQSKLKGVCIYYPKIKILNLENYKQTNKETIKKTYLLEFSLSITQGCLWILSTFRHTIQAAPGQLEYVWMLDSKCSRNTETQSYFVRLCNGRTECTSSSLTYILHCHQ